MPCPYECKGWRSGDRGYKVKCEGVDGTLTGGEPKSRGKIVPMLPGLKAEYLVREC